jgi:uncharacterized DUF497 family protein
MNVFFEYKGWYFEWDSEKAAKNIKEHGISFEQAAIFFRDGESISEPDYKHCIVEERWVDIGMDDHGQMLSVSVTWRETETGATSYRIISAHKIKGEKIPQHRKRLAQRGIKCQTLTTQI